MNVLFVCNQNQNRSKTAEGLFSDQFNTKSAGLYNQKPITEKQLSWAEVVIVMEEEQRKEIARRFPKLYLQKRVLSLDIPDIYHFGDSQLIEMLRSKVEEYSEFLL
ncbi:phosphotyrosine protein phosphatase [Candidatus Woesearchaeota archaeon]|nr:phosphotyrosine protein phosphatase [Candidatus Woesearchaeota archaeon]